MNSRYMNHKQESDDIKNSIKKISERFIFLQGVTLELQLKSKSSKEFSKDNYEKIKAYKEEMEKLFVLLQGVLNSFEGTKEILDSLLVSEEMTDECQKYKEETKDKKDSVMDMLKNFQYQQISTLPSNRHDHDPYYFDTKHIWRDNTTKF